MHIQDVVQMQNNGNSGFTLVEVMIAVVIIGILAMIAYPSYQEYVRKTKRVEVKTTLADIVARLQHYQVANYSYIKPDGKAVTLAELGFQTNAQNRVEVPHYDPVYTVGISDVTNNSWVLSAVPVSGKLMQTDGHFVINEANEKCWVKAASCTPSSSTNWDGK